MIRVRIGWDRVSGTFDSDVTGTTEPVAVVIVDDEGITYANDAAIDALEVER